MSCGMKLRELESHLEKVDVFEKPKILLEQYPTRPHIAACVLHTAQASFGDLEGRSVADLGCGCGVLSVGAVMLGAASVTGFDVDEDALGTFQENLDGFEMSNVDLVRLDVDDLLEQLESDEQHPLRGRFDTVVTNPPFGTKPGNKGIDLRFVRAALLMASRDGGAVYSLHKSATRQHILGKADAWGVRGEVVAEMKFDLPASYGHHKKRSVDIEVDFVRFSFDPKRK